MARRGNRRAGGAGPLIGVAVLTALISVSVTIVLTNGRSGLLAEIGAEVSGTFGRVMMVPVRWVEKAQSSVTSFMGGAVLNQQLKEENRALLQWRDQARAMAERLDAYEKLHGVKAEKLPQGFTGRLIAESDGPFSQSGVINLGSKAGVEVNWIVLNQNGLVGRVIAVGSDTSRVLFLADGDSRVPVMGEVTRARAIASGDKSLAPKLAHLNTPILMRDGERVMTSGDDGVFPRGIAVGQAGIAPDRQWRVRLASSNSPIDFVRVIPPSSFPPPLEPVTPPVLPAAPTEEVPAVPVEGAVMPLAMGAAAVPAAATPDAIRAAQLSRSRELEAAQAAKARIAQKRKAAEKKAQKAAKADEVPSSAPSTTPLSTPPAGAPTP
jgi:rod shape-determining protein MreC